APSGPCAAYVLVECHDGKGVGSGSGIIVDWNEQQSLALVLTNRHVVGERAGREKIYVVLSNGQPCDAVYLGVDPKADLAAVAICPPSYCRPVATVPVAQADAQPGEHVAWTGYPGGHGPAVRTATVRNVRSYIEQTGVYNLALTTPCQRGESGSGVIRQSDGSLVGI